MMTEPQVSDFYISVDIETAGPNPAQYSLLTIGACTLNKPRSTFYVEVQPVNDKMTPESFAIHHLDLKHLSERGHPPAEAMTMFKDWIKSETPPDSQAVFVAFNAPFDWMFVNDYLHRYTGHNPFGHTALDIKAYYMGLSGTDWAQTSMRYVGPLYLNSREITHHALRDAIDQAEIFEKMLAEARSNR
jgi:DNA polymerase III epsilon subunit-like protein